MTKETLTNKLDALARIYEAERLTVIRAYCKENNPYRKGDIITDRQGSIQITSIAIRSGSAECVYTGLILKADGTPRIDSLTRVIWQSNLIGV